MAGISGHTEDTYWIARSEDNSVIHYGLVLIGDIMETGQPILESFTDKQEWIARLSELGIEYVEL